MAYTEGGLRALTDEHVQQHIREDRESQQTRDQAIEYIGPRRDYDVLILSRRTCASSRHAGSL